jgi:N-acetylmuramoyl-L-alanine amidase
MNQMNTQTVAPEQSPAVELNLPEKSFKSERQIEEIIIHCSATKAEQDFSVEDIRSWHLQRGFNDVGYHFIVRLNGRVEPGRNINRIGAHCLGHNRRSIGVCYVGGLDADGKAADTRTSAQRQALVALLRKLRLNHPRATIHGHREFAAKECPCFDAGAEYASL